MLLYLHRDLKDYDGRGDGTRNVHLDFHTAPELWWTGFEFSVALHLQRSQVLLGTRTAQDGHLDFHTAPELWAFFISV